jgi:hypothetical protein
MKLGRRWEVGRTNKWVRWFYLADDACRLLACGPFWVIGWHK